MSPAALPDIIVAEPRVFEDRRGRFFEAWQVERYAQAGIDARFRQDSVSISRRGVIRGLHFQHPHDQGKLVTVLHGAAFDVAVDVRRGSPTFGRWAAQELSAANAQQLWIPPGFAHGFQALADETVFHYKVTELYDLASERTVNYADPRIGIPWPLPEAMVSPRDAAAPALADLPADALPAFA